MTDPDDSGPDITNIEMTALPRAHDPAAALSALVTLHSHVLTQLRQAQSQLLRVKSLSSLVKYLLEDFPASFGSARGELRLHDPEGVFATQLPISKLFGESLTMKSDSYALHQLYADEPEAMLLDLSDERMFSILPGSSSATGAVLMPLLDNHRLIGSYHLGLMEGMNGYGEHELQMFGMLGQLVAASLLRVVESQRADQLTLLDPVTEVGNLRAFRRDMLREIYWARRVEMPIALLFIGLDELEELSSSYGEVASHFVQRRVSQRLCSDLRATDYIAHTSSTHFAVLLPGCNEPHAHDIGERMRQDIDDFAIDDGRGAVLYCTLSIGLVCWEPARQPVESSERLATQMESEAEAVMQKAERAGGNQVAVARLGLLML
ncbi:MAG: diguanylate cyclase (GGDEF)-like protein [Halieaceae bacterium]|jgi:diguanylate cyclase (GGDEF)-like protein